MPGCVRDRYYEISAQAIRQQEKLLIPEAVFSGLRHALPVGIPLSS